MTDRALETLFDRYRRHGDVRALAEVFDRTAPHLRRVARHFARERHEADDLVQATFVVAIERAASFDGARLLVPWLTGILARQAVALNRKRGRELPASELAPRGPDDPERDAEGREAEQRVEAALIGLSSSTRSVLVPYLLEGKGPGEIAGELGCRPGTVRMRLMRGLARLRELLPASLLGGLAASVLAPRALARVRRVVLARAAGPGAWPPAVAAASTSSVASTVAFSLGGAVIVNKQVLWGVAATLVALTAGLSWKLALPSVPPSLPVVERAVEARGELVAPAALVSAPGAGAASEREASAAPAARRTEAKQGALRLRVRLDGVVPEDAPEVTVRVEPGRPDHPFDLLPRPYRATEDVDPCAAALSSDPSTCGSCHAPPVAQQSLRVVDLTLAQALLDVSRGEQAAQPAIVAHGSADAPEEVTIDLTALARDERLAGTDMLRVSGTHPLTFDSAVAVELPARWRERVAEGEQVELECALELVPAAVVRGRVPRENVLDIALVTGRAGWVMGYVHPDMPTAFLDVSTGTAGDAVQELTFVAGGRLLAGLHREREPGVALFPLLGGRPDGTPAAQAHAEADGSFELKVARDGPHAFVAARSDRRPHTRELDLELRTITDLGEVELAAGESIQGMVRGILPEIEGSLLVRAERRARDGDVPVLVAGEALVWSEGAFEWPAREAGVEAGGRFELESLGRAEHAVRALAQGELDARGAQREPRAGETVVSWAPAVGLELALPAAFLDVELTRDGVGLAELIDAGTDPWAAQDLDGDGEPDPLPSLVLEVRAADGKALASMDASAATRVSIVADPGVRYELALLRDEVVIDRRPLESPGAGERAGVSLETQPAVAGAGR